MSRFLFVVPPLVGHVNPTIGVAAELVARGHAVAWAGHHDVVRKLVGDDAAVLDCASPELAARGSDLTGPAAFRFLWQDFLLPLARAMAPGVRAAVAEFAPDVVVADQQAVAGGLVAEELGLPWVTSATTSAELVDPLSGMPKVKTWLAERIDGLRGGSGGPDPRFSPHGVLAFTTRELLGPVELPHDDVWLVGPSVLPRPSTSDFPWEWIVEGTPTVLVTLGTANADAGHRFLAQAAQALSRLPVRAVLVDPDSSLSEVPDNVLVRRHVPQLDLLPRVDAVVCHAGHNTVCESLWHGVPLVVAPIRDDQPIVAGQVVAAGAGVRVRFSRATSAHLADAITTVLDDTTGHRRAAAVVGDSFRAAGGAARAADHLEKV
ncbi:glycosyltransferase [Umezawaea tangerina]|uniref:MGT family glycosyltransferase n=1 Tax=Umezawaea tangerina TaxID=84725 RepID=A0A2T0T5A5_9PSEU|nr:glycosyltransferase [Umezawaea tangerina]PRY40811.1 MGT family glycosyltransferase [Umezawaea tangerina]